MDEAARCDIILLGNLTNKRLAHLSSAGPYIGGRPASIACGSKLRLRHNSVSYHYYAFFHNRHKFSRHHAPLMPE